MKDRRATVITALYVYFGLSCLTEITRGSTLAEMAEGSWDLVE